VSGAREYFYDLDRHGRLLHDGTELSDARFLDAFFARLRANDTSAHPEYPFVSPCAGERNYLRASDGRSAIVFRRLHAQRLLYAGARSVPFVPGALRFSRAGDLYHPAPVGEFGLLGAGVLAALGQDLEERDGRYFVRCGDALVPIEPLRE
jgi:hypothetical protein